MISSAQREATSTESTFDDTGRFACYLNRMVGGMRMALHAHPDGHGEKGIGSDGSTQGRRRILAITVWYLTPRYELRPVMLGVFTAVRETGAEVAHSGCCKRSKS